MKPQNEREEQIGRIIRKLAELPEEEQERILDAFFQSLQKNDKKVLTNPIK